MKTTTKILAFLMLCSALVFAAHSAFAGCEVSVLDDLILEGGNAPGTKLSGPITVFLTNVDEASGTADMYFFMRLRKGGDTYAFAGESTGVGYASFVEQESVIEDFFKETVIPALYNNCLPGTTCPAVALKSYDMDVDQDIEPLGYKSGLRFFIADIVIAVQD